MLRKKALDSLRQFDVHPKTIEEAKEKSLAGAIVTLIAVFLAFLLILSELGEYLSPNRENVLTVNHNLGEKMKINFRINFLSLPCELIGIDVTDRMGDEQVGVKTFEKITWKGNFEVEARSVEQYYDRSDYRFHSRLWDHLREKEAKGNTRACLPCYTAEQRRGQCCNTCYSLKAAYAMRGMPVETADTYPQCVGENSQEGCLLGGSLEVNKVGGNWHIAVGDTHTNPGEKHHHHWPEQVRSLGFNTSHFIHHLSFGEEYPGLINPMDGILWIEPTIGQKQYFLQVVPTTYHSRGTTIVSNQYSFTEHFSPVELTAQHMELPGIFFRYDISPILIHLRETGQGFAHFLMRVCAVVGGVWVVLGLVYSSLKSFVDMIIKQIA